MGVDLGEILEAARTAERVEDYERVVFEHLERRIGFDVALIKRGAGPGPILPGFDRRVLRAIEGRWDRYRAELGGLLRGAVAQGGVAVDVEHFGGARLERTAYYQDIMRPHRGRSTLLAVLEHRGAPIATLVLGRCSPTFSSREIRSVREALSTLAVCEASLATWAASPAPLAGSRPAAPSLSPRERDLIAYLRLGYTNPDIALACGTAPRTVRNQLTKLFAKLEVSTRAEAVSRCFELGLLR